VKKKAHQYFYIDSQQKLGVTFDLRELHASLILERIKYKHLKIIK
jgi:hypothetical protein